MFEHDRTHYSKMAASLMPVLNMLTSSELGHCYHRLQTMWMTAG